MSIIAYIGNFGPEHSTENDVRRTLETMGHTVQTYQEDDRRAWVALIGRLREAPDEELPELVLWTSTYGFSEQIGPHDQRAMQYFAAVRQIPTVGFHLDRWWGLSRWGRVLTEPFFQCDYVVTADGAHNHEFERAGVNHLWQPPGIAPHNALQGAVRREFLHDVAFVGTWQGGYHEEWTHRPQLVQHLRRHWGRRLGLYPMRGREAVRGADLADLYASAKVIVGDSCLVPTTDGAPMHHYCSDRVFETVGRGGLLVHPDVVGITSGERPLLQHAEHLLTWELGNWTQLDETIQFALDQPGERDRIRDTGFDHVMANHTYATRMDWVLGLVGL